MAVEWHKKGCEEKFSDKDKLNDWFPGVFCYNAKVWMQIHLETNFSLFTLDPWLQFGINAFPLVDGEAMESEESDNCSTDTSVVEAEVMSEEEESESEAETGVAEAVQQENVCATESPKEEEEDDQLLEVEKDVQSLGDSDNQDEDDSDVMLDTRAAVLALNLVQQHTNGISQVDTELISQW